ncbi:MAG: hypothetical protein MMC33_004103 [Icmadophila ericetorum]|nr:hypothetical protein [Icmadophila ericetorum]
MPLKTQSASSMPLLMLNAQLYDAFKSAKSPGWTEIQVSPQACLSAHCYTEPFIQRAIARHRKLSAVLEKEDLGQQIQDDLLKSRRYNFLDELVNEENDAEKIRGHVLNILVAGRDTTASLLSSLFFTLARRPDVFPKVQEEVTNLKGRGPTYEDTKEMKYLNYAIKETLRMYTVVQTNIRPANKDTILPSGGGLDGQSPIYVRKGQMVVYQSYLMHRRRDLWDPGANEFKPERWYEARPVFEYLPFNAGHRICPGQQFAIIEAAYTTICLCQAFDKIEAKDDGTP